MAKKLTDPNYHDAACANCGHTDRHSDITGCIHVEGFSAWCKCEGYVAPERDRAADAGIRLGQEGGRVALNDKASQEWRRKAEMFMNHLITTNLDFTSDDITDTVGESPHPNAIGGLFSGAHRAGRIKPVGYETSTRKSAHGRPIRVWRATTTEG